MSYLPRHAIAPAALSLSALFTLSACEPTIFNRGVFAPREPTCEIQILGLGASPPPGYQAAASISFDSAFTTVGSPQELVARYRAQLCEAGGELLQTELGAVPGRYGTSVGISRAWVLHRVTKPETVAADAACTPICSPGFACSAGTCVPQCNPACGADQLCGPDRLCHSETDIRSTAASR